MLPEHTLTYICADKRINICLGSSATRVTFYFLADLLQSFMKLTDTYGTIMKLWLGPRLHLFITKPEIAEYFLNSHTHLSKSNGYDLFKPWLGDGLLVSTGAKWRSRRKLITPTFHFKILEKFLQNSFNK